jgi:hypothetical protein
MKKDKKFDFTSKQFFSTSYAAAVQHNKCAYKDDIKLSECQKSKGSVRFFL